MISQILTAVLLVMALSGAVQAGVVGRFTQAEGAVELLKGGKPPAVPVKLNDSVEPGDAIHTKELSRASVQLLDDSVLTVAPNSQVIIEQYFYEAAKGQRQASIQVLQGLVHTVVTRLFKVKEPDFIVKTVDAVMGVRGTEWYVLKGADSDFTDAFTKTGKISFKTAETALGGRDAQRPALTGVTPNLAPDFSQIGKIAFTSTNVARVGTVLLGAMQTSRIIKNQIPLRPMNFTAGDLQLLQRTLRAGLPPKLAPSTNPRNLLQQIKPFIERQEKLPKTTKLDKKGELAQKIKEALAKDENLPAIMKNLINQGEKINLIMEAALEAGVKNKVDIANAAMVAGAKLSDVRAALAAMGYPGALTFAYTPPAPPVMPALVGATFPGGGGGGGGASGGGGGGVASPSQ